MYDVENDRSFFILRTGLLPFAEKLAAAGFLTISAQKVILPSASDICTMEVYFHIIQAVDLCL